MNRDQPPCNTCTKHDCNTCAWISPLDASYRKLIQSHSLLSIVALNVRSPEPMPSEPSSMAAAGKCLVKFLSSGMPRVK
ncbi:hypothetical protein BHUM_03468 [Candidatus Burkholderia humilis]|nr:hypothetical protein BHUM_03468 [Candidatus Burkholderia humilis]